MLIACGLPDRIESGVGALDFGSLSGLTFANPISAAFPAEACLRCHAGRRRRSLRAQCRQRRSRGRLLAGRIRFTDIERVVAESLDKNVSDGLHDIGSLLAQDAQTRSHAQQYIAALRG